MVEKEVVEDDEVEEDEEEEMGGEADEEEVMKGVEFMIGVTSFSIDDSEEPSFFRFNFLNNSSESDFSIIPTASTSTSTSSWGWSSNSIVGISNPLRSDFRFEIKLFVAFKTKSSNFSFISLDVISLFSLFFDINFAIIFKFHVLVLDPSVCITSKCKYEPGKTMKEKTTPVWVLSASIPAPLPAYLSVQPEIQYSQSKSNAQKKESKKYN